MAEHRPPEDTRIVGRIGRLLLGMALIALAVDVFLRTDWAFQSVVLVIVAGATVFYTGVHLLIIRFFGRLNPWIGAFLSVAPPAIAFLLGNTKWQTAVVTYIGVSLVIDAIRRDAGCEVMAIPTLLLGQRTRLVCILFSPIDWVEQRFARNKE